MPGRKLVEKVLRKASVVPIREPRAEALARARLVEALLEYKAVKFSERERA